MLVNKAVIIRRSFEWSENEKIAYWDTHVAGNDNPQTVDEIFIDTLPEFKSWAGSNIKDQFEVRLVDFQHYDIFFYSKDDAKTFIETYA